MNISLIKLVTKVKADYGGSELKNLMYAEFGEAHNASELARRILYGYYK